MNPTPATIAIPGYLAGIWKADPVHSEIGFSVRLLIVGKVRGRSTSYDVTAQSRGRQWEAGSAVLTAPPR